MGYTRGTPRDIVLAEVEHMLSFGEPPSAIARTLSLRPESVAKSLWRSGRGDLAVKFERVRPQPETHPCTDCGAPVVMKAALRCRPCGYVARERRRHEGATHCPREGCPRYLNEVGRCTSHGFPKGVAA